MYYKKKCLFVITAFGCGGINRALQNLLSELTRQNDETRYDILVMDPSGMFDKEFKKYNVITSGNIISLRYVRLRKVHGLKKIASIITKIVDKVTGGGLVNLIYNGLIKRIVTEQYDSIVAFSEGIPTNFVSRIPHKNKIAWIHCDYKSYLTFANTTMNAEREIYETYKTIVNVSEYTTRSFTDVFPEFASKSISIYNIMDTAMMKEMSKKESGDSNFDSFDGIKLLTVGRIDHIKNQTVIPRMASEIKAAGLKFKWFIIGPNAEAPVYDKLIDNINKYNVEKEVVVLGERTNPYPFIANSTLLVNTSVSEACPYVINEAKILGTPVVCPNFGSAKEFVDNGINGYSLPIEEISGTIIRLLNDTELYNGISNNLKQFRYGNESIIYKTRNIIL